MLVKQKIILISATLSGLLILLVGIFFVTNNEVADKLDTASQLSKASVSSSAETQSQLENIANQLSDISKELSEKSEPLQTNNQRLQILTRKSGSVDERLADLSEMLTDLIDELPADSEATFIAEDSIDELADIRNELSREFITTLEETTATNDTVSSSVVAKASELEQLNLAMSQAFEQLLENNKNIVSNNQNAIATIDATRDIQGGAAVTMAIAIFVIAIMVIAANIYIFILVTRPLDAINRVLGLLAQGDFRHSVDYPKQDEFGKLAASLNTMVSSMKLAINNVARESQRLQQTANEMAATSNETKHAVEKEQMEIQSIAAAMTQMLSTVHSVAQAANDTLTSSEDTKNASEQGIQIVGSNITTVKSLSNEILQASEVVSSVEKHTEAIDKILDVIKDITEQTNLLALNAAIEAARAGESGRGFAVVADEVRQLATRTQHSTEEIAVLIDRLHSSSKNAVAYMQNSEQSVQHTSTEASRTSEVFNQIVAKISAIRDQINAVAVASEEQNSVTQDVQSRIKNIEYEAEHVAKLADTVVSQSSAVKGASENMAQQLHNFKL